MTKPAIDVLPMNLDGLREAIEWAGREGWEPGLNDAAAFLAADPDGYFRTEVDQRTSAMISVVRASVEVAFVGMYIVAPELRGQGIGKALWDEVLDRFEDFTLGLDAVPEQEATYASDGFVTAHGNARYSAEGLPSPDVGGGSGFSIVPAAGIDFDALVDFDASHFFGPRPAFLREWTTGDGREALVASGPDRRIRGFAASRLSANGHRIGPVFADDSQIARQLILTLADRAEGRVFVDVPQPNESAVSLLESMAMERSFETRRMYRGPAPDLPLNQIFGITTLELG